MNHETPRPDAFTQGCRDFIRSFTYEDILAWTIYAPPMLFMVGPASMAADSPLINLLLNTVIGFAGSGVLHRIGHRLLAALPNEPQRIYLSRSVRLPVRLTFRQFLWLLEIIVAAATFSGIVGKRFFQPDDPVAVAFSFGCFALGLILYMLPIRLGRLWIARYHPATSLVGPTEDVIKQALPGIRWFYRRS